jgi:serine/threonine-protein kinase
VRAESQLAGRTLADRYDILALIGVGGMGAVYRARDRELDELVALKVIRSELADDPSIVERFRHEVKLARRVTHVNVARTFELGSADGLMFCTMELIEGESLTRRLARWRQLSAAEAATIACAVCEALAAAHAVGVIHRDIKPDNVMIATTGRVVLADFGIASITVDDRGDVSGTPAYMAPEQARGEPPTPATDVYAVGVLLHEMVTGTRSLAQSAAVRIEPALARVIAAATAPDVAQRTSAAAALRDQLAPWTQGARLEPDAPQPGHAGELRTVLVLAPHSTGDRSRLYLAEAFHEALLQRLTRQPRLRVVSRDGATSEPDATVVALQVGDVLTMTVSAPDRAPAITLRLPLAVGQLDAAVEAATSAILTSVVFERAPGDDPETEALDLLLQARHFAKLDVERIDAAVAPLERAHQLLPDDPRIAANLAILQTRLAFFRPELSAELIARSAALVRIALAAGPRLAESHLAAGRLELNLGEASVAAGHYRVAIACAPHDAEAHESLGRMLLEAGFLEPAFARIAQAIAISPSVVAVRWDLARAFALEQRWAEHDAVMADLRARNFDRPHRSEPLRVRFAIWRGDRAAVEAIVAATEGITRDPLISGILAAYTEGAWPELRDFLVAQGHDRSPPLRRRRTFNAQLVAETAGHAGDGPSCLLMVRRAVEEGLFDLHWLEKCPLLQLVRGTAELAALHARVKQRADAVLDALYGDHVVGGLSDTLAASIP